MLAKVAIGLGLAALIGCTQPIYETFVLMPDSQHLDGATVVGTGETHRLIAYTMASGGDLDQTTYDCEGDASIVSSDPSVVTISGVSFHEIDGNPQPVRAIEALYHTV